jgi:DedD protein
MSERTRYRLTGGILLISLAGILLPMLFDGAGVATVEVPPVTPVATDSVEITAPALDEKALAEATALRERIDDDGFDADTGTRLGEPRLTSVDEAPTAPVDAWAVQLASFSDHSNAVAMLDQLRKDGYAGLLSEVKSGTARSTRVAVGPIIERDEAERLKTELAQRYSADALVVRLDQ